MRHFVPPEEGVGSRAGVTGCAGYSCGTPECARCRVRGRSSDLAATRPGSAPLSSSPLARFPLEPARAAAMSASPNTALLSLPPLRPSPHKGASFARSSSSSTNPKSSSTTKRARSSSIVSVQEVADTYDDQLDQAALNNVNAEWVNYKGKSQLPSRSPHLPWSPVERVIVLVQCSERGTVCWIWPMRPLETTELTSSSSLTASIPATTRSR